MKSLRAPLLLFALPALLVAFMPARHALLLLDREALAAGNVWRLWTGHWVHFSTAHLAWNLVVVLAAGFWLERTRPGLLWRHIAVAAPIISLSVLIAEPGLQAYGGLSGLATGVVVLLGLHELRAPGAARWLWAGILGIVALKTTHDHLRLAALFTDFGASGVRTASTAHVAGILMAGLHSVAIRCSSTREAGSIAPQGGRPHLAPVGAIPRDRRQAAGGPLPNNGRTAGGAGQIEELQ